MLRSKTWRLVSWGAKVLWDGSLARWSPPVAPFAPATLNEKVSSASAPPVGAMVIQRAVRLRANTVSENRPPSVARAGVGGETTRVISIESPGTAIGDWGGGVYGSESATHGSSQSTVPAQLPRN